MAIFKKSRAETGGVSGAKKQLLEAEKQLRLKEQEIVKQLQVLPVKAAQIKKRQRDLKAQFVSTTAGAEYINRVGPRDRSSARQGRGSTTLRRQARDARFKFVFLCLIFLSILFVLWRVIPS